MSIKQAVDLMRASISSAPLQRVGLTTLLLLASVAFAQPHGIPTTKPQHATLGIEGVNREYSYFQVESTRDEPKPVVIYLHGHGDNRRHILGRGRLDSASSKWMDIARRENLLVIYPLGAKASGRRAKRGWNDCRNDARGNPKLDDVLFISTLIDVAINELGGDRRQIYVTGMSNGGHMAMRVAMEIPERIAAIAPISALLPKASLCKTPQQPTPILLMHGTADPLAPYDGGTMAGGRGTVHSARETVRQWTRWNKVASMPAESRPLPDRDATDQSSVVRHHQGANSENNVVVALRNPRWRTSGAKPVC